MRRLVPVLPVLLLAVLLAAYAGDPLTVTGRDEVTVRRVQVDVVVVPHGDDPRSCRDLDPGDLVARVGHRTWRVEAIDWEGAGVQEGRSVEAEESCLQLAVYLGRYSTAVPMDCPWIPGMRLAAPFEPPSRDMHAGYGHDVYLAVRRLVEGLRPCDRVSFWRKRNSSVMEHTRWVRGREAGLAVLDALESGDRTDPRIDALLLEQPWDGGWDAIVPALGALPGPKDLVVVDASDRVFFTGEDPWRLAHLVESARRARVTIHRVDPVTEGRVNVPGTADALATGGLIVRGGARARLTEEIRRRAFCRARVTLAPPGGIEPQRYRTVSFAVPSGRFDVVGTSWLVEDGAARRQERRLADWLRAGEGDHGLAVAIRKVSGCAASGRGKWQRCEADVLVRPSGPLPVEPAAAGVASWSGGKAEFAHVYGLAPGGPVERTRRIRLPFRARPGRRTLCVMVFDRQGTFLGSACRTVHVPDAVEWKTARR